MIKVFASPTLAVVKLAHDVLVQNEIGCTIRNERLGGAVGELPWTEVWPELWVLDERQADRARELMAAFEGEQDPLDEDPPWTCERCGEQVDAPFTDCWNCGSQRPGLSSV